MTNVVVLIYMRTFTRKWSVILALTNVPKHMTVRKAGISDGRNFGGVTSHEEQNIFCGKFLSVDFSQWKEHPEWDMEEGSALFSRESQKQLQPYVFLMSKIQSWMGLECILLQR